MGKGSKSANRRNKFKNVVNIEIQGNKRYFVARSTKGSILGKKPVIGSKTTLNQAREQYSKNGSFNPSLKREIYVGSHVSEITLSTEVYTNKNGIKSFDVGNKPRGKLVQYMCRGTFRGEIIAVRSKFISKYDISNGFQVTQAKNDARNSFLAKLGQKFNKENKYDADEGKLHIEEVKNYNEGWVYYLKKY